MRGAIAETEMRRGMREDDSRNERGETEDERGTTAETEMRRKR